ncbi:hypothetical protein BG003_003344 [Podila horticola]|nr:hypothetical protein BG003_003344 [Podila horticola]
MASLSDNDKKIDMDAPAIPYNVTPYQSHSSLPPPSTSPRSSDIPVSRPSPFDASFASPSQTVARLDSTHEQSQPPTSYHRTPSSFSFSSSSSCGSNRHATRAAHKEERRAVKALEKSVKHETKLLAREESQLAKTAKREAKALRKEVEHHAKVITKEFKYQAQETVASVKRSLRDKLYDYEQQFQLHQEKNMLEQQQQQQHCYSGGNGCSHNHKRHPWSPTQPAMAPMAPPPQVPHAFAPSHIPPPPPPPAPPTIPTLHYHHNSHHVAKQQRKLEKHLTREQRRQQKIEYKQQRKINHLVHRDCRRHHHLHSHSFPMRILGSVLSKGLNLLTESSSSHPPQQVITAPVPAPAPAPAPGPPLPSRGSHSSSPSCSRTQPKAIGPQEPVLVYAMSHISLNAMSAPSAPALPPHHEPTPVAMAVPRADLERYRTTTF